MKIDNFECARPIRGYDCYHGDKSFPYNLSSHHFMLTTEACNRPLLLRDVSSNGRELVVIVP